MHRIWFGLKTGQIAKGNVIVSVFLIAAACVQPIPASSQELLGLVQEKGRAILMVDNTPFFVLGAQVVSFPPSYDPPAATVSTTSDTTALHVGRAVIASPGPNQFLVGGIDCRVQFLLPVHDSGKQAQMLKVEEGPHDGTAWVSTRLWNGDETDYGLNVGGKGSLLRVTMGSY